MFPEGKKLLWKCLISKTNEVVGMFLNIRNLKRLNILAFKSSVGYIHSMSYKYPKLKLSSLIPVLCKLDA